MLFSFSLHLCKVLKCFISNYQQVFKLLVPHNCKTRPVTFINFKDSDNPSRGYLLLTNLYLTTRHDMNWLTLQAYRVIVESGMYLGEQQLQP